MVTRLTVKGQVVLPDSLRRKLRIRPGDRLDFTIQHGSIVLTPQRPRVYKARIVVDPLTGLPVLTVSKGSATLSAGQVEEILATFP
jgi:AbrB family looped-hinge helix DNA binding protein